MIGLRSPALGPRCEAVVTVPRLLHLTPFPYVVNTIFLNLADLFANR